MTKQRGVSRTAVGVVTSDKMAKTIVVESVRRVPHPLYGKLVKHVTRYRAHDESNEAREGDRVRLVSSRPRSKTKAWRLVEIIQAGPRVE